MNINNSVKMLKAGVTSVTPFTLIKIGVTLLPVILGYSGEAMAIDVDLDAGGKAFFDPVVMFIDKWAPVGIFAGGVIGLIAIPGDLHVKAIGAGGGMAVAGLMILAGKKMLGVSVGNPE